MAYLNMPRKLARVRFAKELHFLKVVLEGLVRHYLDVSMVHRVAEDKEKAFKGVAMEERNGFGGCPSFDSDFATLPRWRFWEHFDPID